MSLTRKIGAYLCTAAMVFSLNVKSDALVKEILQVPGIVAESIFGAVLSYEGKKSKVNENSNKMIENNKDTGWDVFSIAIGLLFLFDAIQRAYFLAFGDGNSKAEKTDNKELNKKNEKKVKNA